MIRQALKEFKERQIKGIFKQILEVGMYWKGVKGRFNSGKGGSRRSYLAMKYGYRWLSRVKSTCGRINIIEQTLKKFSYKKSLANEL